ncbi:MAG: serine/threonine protein kinase, partial [Pirellulales bacterium]|nr:serine/threonine protein kinase [Pirellulales bacterium]
MDASSSSETGANPTDEALLQILESTISRIQGGESLDVEQLVKQHPQYARELRELLPAASLMLAWGRSQRPHPNGTRRPDAIDPAESLGDFRLLREIGRGGMGVVYEAEQLSLGRRVAVKVLPLASMLDRQRLARFQNEARAAATLNHPHIVPVYAVGCDRGVHYYAMQLVEGSSLAQILETIRRQPRRPDHGGGSSVETSSDAAVEGPASASISTIPEFSSRRYCRRAAQLIAEAAESLEHAHARGILHRDVKPANLLVDETGKLWVTDFG